MQEAVSIEHIPRIDAIGEDLGRLAELRRQSWAVRSDRGIEVLCYRQGVAAFEHKQMEKGASFQRRLDDIGIVDGPAREAWEHMLVTTEGEHRRRLRMPFITLLRAPQIRKLQEAVRAIIEDMLDEIGDFADVDLMADVAWKIPSRVYCHLVAAPIEFAPLAARLSDSTLAPILTSDPSRRQESIDAFNETYEFVKRHLSARRRAGLGEDFASIMIRQHLDGQQSEEELIYEGIALLQASVDNTVHQIGLTLGTLLEDEARWRTVVADAEQVRPASEETMRLASRFNTIFRYAAKETDLEGLAIPADTWVFVSLLSANRDENMFDDPDTFRLDRRIGRALQFGGGPYSCLGQILARLELHEVVHAMRKRFPDARLNGEWTRHVTNAVTETRRLRACLL